MDQLIFAFLSHAYYWYEVGMLKVPALVVDTVYAEPGRNPVSKHQIQLAEYGDEQADAGRDCRTRFARPNS